MKQKTIIKIIKELNKLYSVKPWRESPFKLLISTILSQRTKDEITDVASRRLFKVANTPEKILKLSERQIIKLIYPSGFYRQKARRIKQICQLLLEKYSGKVPTTREELMKLPGVGYKTSDIILCYGFGLPVIAVDVHVNVVAKKLGIANEIDDLETVREKLHKLVPERLRSIVNNLFVEFGKEYCRTAKPRCKICPIVKLCLHENKNL